MSRKVWGFFLRHHALFLALLVLATEADSKKGC